MTIDIPVLIEQRPHLKDPLQFYARWQRFDDEVRKLLPRERSFLSAEDCKAYPREISGQVFEAFVSIFDLPPETIAPLLQSLQDGAIDFMRLPLSDIPQLPLPAYSEEDLAGLLFLFSRPYFLTLREHFPLDGSPWVNGHCPLCSAPAALASISEGPKRHLHCSFCGTFGDYTFIGCPNCETTDTDKLNTIVSEDEPGFRVITCDACRTYVKIVENSVLKEMGADIADTASLPLDIIAQEKGYARTAPNPISLKRIV